MAYICKQLAPVSAANFYALIVAELVNMGWVLHDAIAATTNVYRSAGEIQVKLTEYIHVNLVGNAVQVFCYGWWNNATHAGSSRTSAFQGVTYGAGKIYVIAGDKDLVLVRIVADATGDLYFGHFPKRFHTTPFATLTAGCAAGNGIVISVDNTTSFVINQTYWIMDSAGAGRWRANVTAINPGVSLTVDNLGSALSAGSVIGANASLFVASSNSVGSGLATWDRTITGNGNSAGDDTPISSLIGTLTYFDPDQALGYALAPYNTPGMYALQPIKQYKSSVTPFFVNGISDTNFLSPPLNVAENTFGITASGAPIFEANATVLGSDATHVGCAGGFGAVNGLVNKIIIIASGTGAGQTRRIISNTDTIAEVSTLDTIPNATSHFFVVDSAYRTPSFMTTICYKEIL